MYKFYVFIILFFAILLQSSKAEIDLQIVWQKYVFPTEINYAKFSADGNFIYCVVGNNIHKMDVKTGEFISAFDNTGMIGVPFSMSISDLGNYIITINSSIVTIWDTKSEKLLKNIHFEKKPGYDGALAVDIFPDEKYIIAWVTRWINDNTTSASIIVYDFNNDTTISQIPFNEGTRIVRITHNGKYFVTGSSYKDNYHKWRDKLTLWETGTWKPVSIIENTGESESQGEYNHIKFSYDDKFVGSLTRSPRVVHLFNLETKSLVLTSDISKSAINFEFLPDSSYISFNYDDLQVFSLKDLKFKKKFNYLGWGMTSSPANKNIFIYGADNVFLLNQNTSGIIENKINELLFDISTENGKIIIEPQFSVKKFIDITITDLLGKQIYTETIEPQTGMGKYELKTNLPTGVYVCRAIVDNKANSQIIEIVR